MISKQGSQILKSRDDYSMVVIDRDGELNKPLFKLAANVEKCSWAKCEPFGPETLRPRIEPWLTALVQSEHLSLLIGSGLTHAVHGIATCKALSGMGTVTLIFSTMKYRLNQRGLPRLHSVRKRTSKTKFAWRTNCFVG